MFIPPFVLPDELSAREPQERWDRSGAGVRLMVIDRSADEIIHTHFDRLSEFFRAGDLLVFNSSRTLWAAMCHDLQSAKFNLSVRLADVLSDDVWLAMIACQGRNPAVYGLQNGMEIVFSEELTAVVECPNPDLPQIWTLRFSRSSVELVDLLYSLGQPVSDDPTWYAGAGTVQRNAVQEPGSTEILSLEQMFIWRLLFELGRRSVDTAYILLQREPSSLHRDAAVEPTDAATDTYIISQAAADKINQTHDQGGRVVAVETAAVRALEAVADPEGRVWARYGSTAVSISATHQLKAVDGLLVGLHEPKSSYLDLLTAFVPAHRLLQAYEEAKHYRYLWHKFGDLNLII